MFEPVFLGRMAGLGNDIPEKAEDTLFIMFVLSCAGFGWDRVSRLHSSWYGAVFGFVTRAALITQGCVSCC